MSERLAPQQRALRNAVTDGDWQSVFDQADSLERAWESYGMGRSRYNRYRIEALIGLGRTKEALLMFTKGKPRTKPTGDILYALALALEGKLDRESATRMANYTGKFYESVPSLLPERPSKEQLIVLVRIARALEAGISKTDDRAIREAKEALKYDEDNAVAAYILAEALSHQGRKAEALPYWRMATAIPGELGKHAEFALFTAKRQT